MDITTSYMGMKLRSPLIVSSSRLTNAVDKVRDAAQYNPGAIVLKSLFEEQILAESGTLMDQEEMYFWYPEAINYMDNISKENGVDNYLKLIRQSKGYTDIPIIASINCVSPNEWPKFAGEIEKAGADGLEINISILPSDHETPADIIMQRYVDIINEVKKYTKLPLAMKIAPYFSNLNQAIKTFDESGVNAIVMFNRYYRPDIDIESMEVTSDNIFSAPEEVTEALRWVALMSPKVKCDISASSGIHDFTGVVKQLLAGANTTQLCSTLIIEGVEYIENMHNDLRRWMKRHNFESLDQFRGLVAKKKDNIPLFERVQYMKRTPEERKFIVL